MSVVSAGANAGGNEKAAVHAADFTTTLRVFAQFSAQEYRELLQLVKGKFGRGEKIRTSDPLHPMQVRYQAALRPDEAGNYIRISQPECTARLRTAEQCLCFMGWVTGKYGLMMKSAALAARSFATRHAPGAGAPHAWTQFADVPFSQ
jgi:hypothetical protein